MQKNSFLRVAATGGLLIGLGMLSLGCAGGDHSRMTGMDGPNSDSPDSDFANKPKDPDITPATRFAAGQLSESRGDWAEAQKQYRLALKDDPKQVQSLFRLAIVETQLKQYPSALQTWKQYIAATDNSATGYANLGYCYELAGASNEAEAAYQRGIARDGKNQTCRVNYGLMLAAEARPAEAITQLQEVLTPAETHYDIGSVYEGQGHKEQAKVEYRKALDMDPKLTDAQKRLDALK